MGYYADCYVLTNDRTKKFVDKFLNTFVPHRKEQVDIYEVPQYKGDTEMEFYLADQVIQYLEINVNIPYTIYWENLHDAEPRFANCFFTDDNNLIVGLGCNTDDITENDLLAKLMKFCGTEFGYITYEQPAPRNSTAFIAIAKSAME
ncbi:hypothetical protein [Pseudochryseolinea flava]|uniref:Uncharacterized protein n=1 Tax=Pseudochryseolinea flava TaxID=2059302 RepID=A0A364Y2E4_9BACT|nr:hypothetical protein [Pseudochryseolinea flava]RAW00277.1 hypothetical protein DQQ10_14560 [Pseudochryseolinea flava]